MRPFLLTAFLAVFSWPAEAQEQCADRDRMVAHYDLNWGEKPQSMGLLRNGALLEVLVNQITKTFTVLVTSVSMRSCVVSTGKYWEGGFDHDFPPDS